MKNAMKKLTSLLLVALLLVGMIPFAASADETYSVEVLIKGFEPAMRVSAGAGESFESVYNWCANQKGIDTSAYTASFWWYDEGASQGTGNYNAIPGNGTLHVALTAKEAPTEYCYLCGEVVTSGSVHVQNCETCNVQWCGSHECPPAAPAPTPAHAAINWEIKYSEGGVVVKSGSFEPNGETANVKDILYYHAFERSNAWQDKYECTKAWSSLYQKNVGYDGFVPEGDTVSIVLSPKTGSSTGNSGNTGSTGNTGNTGNNVAVSATLQVTVNGVSKVNSKATVGKTVSALLAASNLDYASAWTSYYTVNSVKINGVSYNRVDITVNSGDAVEVALTRNYSKDNSHKVYLHVYLNGNAGTIAKTLDITGTYLMYDWATDVNEVKNYLSANFYNAANSNGLELDGLYISAGHFPTNYYSNNKQTSYTADALKNDLENNHVNISVMLKNAVVKGSATADKSNPKTGDSIYTAMTVMGVSAASLAAVMYFYNKKRMAL